jgi:hypothetical protein
MAESKYYKNQSENEKESEDRLHAEEEIYKQGELDMPKSPLKQFVPDSGTWSRFIDDSSGFPYFYNEKSGER